MVLFGRVIDNEKKSAIQAATVAVFNQGNQVATGITDDIGRFTLNSAAITLDSLLSVSHVNYFDEQLPITGISDYGFIALQEKPPAPQRPADPEPPAVEKTNWLLWLLIAAGIYLIVKRKRK